MSPHKYLGVYMYQVSDGRRRKAMQVQYVTLVVTTEYTACLIVQTGSEQMINTNKLDGLAKY